MFLHGPEIGGGQALARLPRPGNAGSNTAADHVRVLGWALESLPAGYRPHPHDPGAHQIWGGPIPPVPPTRLPTRAAHAAVGFSFGYAVDDHVREAVDMLNATDSWYPTIDADGGIRDGAWVAKSPGWSR